MVFLSCIFTNSLVDVRMCLLSSTFCLYGCIKKYHKTACPSLPEDEHLDVRNMKTVYLNYNINPLNAKLNPICHSLALLGAHHIPHLSRIRVNVRSVHFVGSYYIGIHQVIQKSWPRTDTLTKPFRKCSSSCTSDSSVGWSCLYNTWDAQCASPSRSHYSVCFTALLLLLQGTTRHAQRWPDILRRRRWRWILR